MKIAFCSRRPFPDGPVRQPFLENDPANIAYVLGGEYFSFLSLKKLSGRQLDNRLKPYDLVFVALDLRNLDIVERIAGACEGRMAAYSEGGIADYQMHSAAGQYSFLRLIRSAAINFLYWEKFVPFYRSLTEAPVEFLPYPYLTDEVNQFFVPDSARPRQVTLPGGLTGATRNGLSSLAVAKQLLERNLITQINCWLSTPTFAEDAQVVQYFLNGSTIPRDAARTRFSWRRWLQRSRLDYRPLLHLRNSLFGKRPGVPKSALVQTSNLALYRRQTWLNYMAEVASSSLVIDMNNRETVGRNALDCAALGIVCVSTDRSDMQPRLFPETTLEDSWEIERAVTLCQRLLQDTPYYQAIVDYAAETLKQFEQQAFLERWQRILERYPQLRRLESTRLHRSTRKDRPWNT